ncbi:MAG: LiaF-related protein, partial [Candidatus Marinimicrobia bacterium]|nr:LiaF-related protein [Candidatus Neomarinimicrobiota bacterium]
HWHQIWRLWPVILIIIGIGMLLKRSSKNAGDTSDFMASSDDRLEINSIFSSTERQISSQQFRGGEINAVFGNIKLDLRSAKVVPEGCHLRANAIFGSIEIYVSPGASVNFKGFQFLGRVDNLATVSGSGPTITIDGDAVFGNIRISN